MAKVKVSRSAISGKFITPSYAKAHKKITVTETIRRSGHKKSKGK